MCQLNDRFGTATRHAPYDLGSLEEAQPQEENYVRKLSFSG